MHSFQFLSSHSSHSFQFQNLKNENGTLRQHLEELVLKLKHLEDESREESVKKTDREQQEEKVERGIQGAESCRGEGEGRVRMMVEREKRRDHRGERRGEIIGTHREAGVGEEILRVQGVRGETCDEEVEPNRRGEAEGGQKDRGKQEKERPIEAEQTGVTTCSKHPKTSADDVGAVAAGRDVGVQSGPDVESLTNRLQEAQEEADRQAMGAQDLRSKLMEQSKKTWEAEQRLVVLEAELQHLKKAAESLGDARRRIEVDTTLKWFLKLI